MRSTWLALFPALLLLTSCSAGDREIRTPASTMVEDLSGAPIDPLDNDHSANVLLFVRTDCPIGNRYAPEIRRLRAQFGHQGVGFWLVYVDPSESDELIRQHVEDYELDLPVLRDPRHVLVAASGATVTPEAALFDAERHLLYHGRIDDRHVDFGLARPKATRHELLDAVTAHLAGDPIPSPSEPAVGCFIQALE